MQHAKQRIVLPLQIPVHLGSERASSADIGMGEMGEGGREGSWGRKEESERGRGRERGARERGREGGRKIEGEREERGREGGERE